MLLTDGKQPIQGFQYQFECPACEWNDSFELAQSVKLVKMYVFRYCASNSNLDYPKAPKLTVLERNRYQMCLLRDLERKKCHISHCPNKSFSKHSCVIFFVSLLELRWGVWAQKCKSAAERFSQLLLKKSSCQSRTVRKVLQCTLESRTKRNLKKKKK